MFLKQIKISGYKKHEDFQITFNDKINILIGENEAGKSTILEAIDIVLNQKYFNSGDINQIGLFSKINIEKFLDLKTIESLPKILVEVFFEVKGKPETKLLNFFGEHNSDKTEAFGISFKFSFDDTYKKLFKGFDFSKTPIIPIDYYKAEWNTFSGMSYNRRINPLKSLTIDNSLHKYGVFDNFAKELFESTFSVEEQNNLSFLFRSNIDNFLTENMEGLSLDNEQKFSISENKTAIKSLLTIEDKGIALQHKGKGMENIIKTRRALSSSPSKLILIEEPENHLSHLNLRKLINDILKSQDSAQIILATHNPLVVSRLGLNNILWLDKNKAKSFEDISKEATEYFLKVDHTNILQFLLSKKVIIVEGAAEYILLDKLFQSCEITEGNSLDAFNIEVISGGGITYTHYIEVAKYLNKPLLVITDNDRNEEYISKAYKQNSKFETNGQPIKIKMASQIDIFTFEIALYESNKALLKDLTTENASPIYKGEEYDKVQAFMLNNKTTAALRIEQKYENIVCPDYIAEGIEWLINC